MARAHILQSCWSIEMLGTRREIQPFISKYVFTVHCIIRIDIIGNWVCHVNIDAARGINYLDEPSQSYPGIIVDGNAEILRNGKAAQPDSVMVIRVTIIKCLVQFHHAISRHIDIEVAWYGEHSNAFCRGINSDDDICLCQVAILKFLVCITPQQQYIDTSTAQNVTAIPACQVWVVFSFKQRRRLTHNIAHRSGKVCLVIVEAGATQDDEEGQHCYSYARPDGETPLFLAPSIFLAFSPRPLDKWWSAAWTLTLKTLVAHCLPLPAARRLTGYGYLYRHGTSGRVCLLIECS